MKYIYNLVDIDLKTEENEHLLINGLNGLADVIRGQDYETFKRWDNSDALTVTTEREEQLYRLLVKRGYLVEDTYNEQEIKDDLISRLKEKSEKRIRDCANVTFVLTYDCNFCCPYCYERSIRNERRLTRRQADKIFEIHGNNLRNIGFFGGEPLLPENMDIIKYIISKAPEASYSMITNGFCLPEYYDLLKDIRISDIQVTLDGRREEHNRTRRHKDGGGTYDKIMSGIKLYAEAGIPLTIRMNVSEDNLEGCLAEKAEISQNAWAKAIKFELQPVFQLDGQNKTSLEKQLFEDDIKSCVKNEILKRQGTISNFLYRGARMQPKVKACVGDYIQRFYDPEGNIYTCTVAVGDKHKRVGRYEPELVWDENSMLKRDITTIPKCRQCKLAFFCGGGCPNMIPDKFDILTTPNCQIMLNEIENVIPQIYKLRKAEYKT